MKNEYEKYIEEVREMKDNVYEDFEKSDKENYVDFIKEELKGMKIQYRKKQENVA
ncbi:MAG: hypothetical protein GY754_24520 [bacterium]|nr:hypothetical protein [bacterium]